MRIFFVYAFQPGSQNISSPYCITNHLYNYFKKRAKVTYEVWDSMKVPEPDPETIFIGHPHYEPKTIVQQVFRQDIKFKAKCSIHPFHHMRVQDNLPFDHITEKADKLFSICGPYWYDTIEETQFRHWKPKMTRLDMAINGEHFPFLRKKFNPIGQRKLIYIGSSMPQKNLRFMEELMRNMPNVRLRWVGGSSDHPLAKLENVDTIGWCNLNKEFCQKLIDECDIFINTSISDANPTTLLEARALGFITACTVQSGYHNDQFFTELNIGDLSKSIKAIKSLLKEDEEVLLKRAIESRKEIEIKYTWDKFCGKIWEELVKLDA